MFELPPILEIPFVYGCLFQVTFGAQSVWSRPQSWNRQMPGEWLMGSHGGLSWRSMRFLQVGERNEAPFEGCTDRLATIARTQFLKYVVEMGLD